MKKTCVFRGVATALITPFSEGSVDYSALDLIIEKQIESGISALVIGGTTGEAATLSREEKEALYGFAKEKTGGRVKLILGVGTNDTRASLQLVDVANRVGCDGVLAVTPYYNKGTSGGVVTHYLKIAEKSKAPVILYNVPSRTGVNLTLEQIKALAAHSNVAAIKEASDSAERMVALASLREKIGLIAGNDSQIYSTMSLGGDGVISVLSNLFPEAVSRLVKSFLSADHREALKQQIRLLPIIDALFSETNPTPVKYAMSKKGFATEEVRLPLEMATQKTKRRIDRLLNTVYKNEK